MTRRILAIMCALMLLCAAVPFAAAEDEVIEKLTTTVLSAPFEGQKPNFSIGLKESDVAQVYSVTWAKVTGGAVVPLTQDSVFELDQVYELTLMISLQPGHAFATDNIGQAATKVTIRRQYIERYADASFVGDLLCARYVFDPCEALQDIDNVTLVFDSPQPGRRPDYKPYFFGFVGLDPAYNSDGFYGGMKWIDATDNVTLSSGDTLTQGHNYRILMALTPDHGYRFAKTADRRLNFTAVTPCGTVSAVAHRDGSDSSQHVLCEMRITDLQPAQEITQAQVEVVAPAINQPVGYTATVADDAPYYLESVDWEISDSANPDSYDWYVNTLPWDEQFHAEKSYRIEVVVLAKAGYVFADYDEVTATVNGKAATTDYFQGDRGCKLHRVFDFLTVPGMTDAQKETAKENAEAVEKLIWPLRNKEITPADRAAVEAARAAFDALTPYEQSLTECGWVLRQAEEALAALPADAVIKGDVNQNGQVTAADALLALQAATGKITLTAEQQAAADVDGQSGVTAADALMILQAATGKITAF